MSTNLAGNVWSNVQSNVWSNKTAKNSCTISSQDTITLSYLLTDDVAAAIDTFTWSPAKAIAGTDAGFVDSLIKGGGIGIRIGRSDRSYQGYYHGGKWPSAETGDDYPKSSFLSNTLFFSRLKLIKNPSGSSHSSLAMVPAVTFAVIQSVTF